MEYVMQRVLQRAVSSVVGVCGAASSVEYVVQCVVQRACSSRVVEYVVRYTVQRAGQRNLAVPRCVPCRVVCHVVPCCAMLCHVVPCCAMLCHVVSRVAKSLCVTPSQHLPP